MNRFTITAACTILGFSTATIACGSDDAQVPAPPLVQGTAAAPPG